MQTIHRKYLLSKINVIIISIIIFVALFCYLSTVNINLNTYERWLNRKNGWVNFYNTTLFVGKFIGIIMGSFIIGTAFGKEQDSYNVLFLRNKKNRIQYFLSKSLTINFILFAIIFFLGVMGLLTISVFSSWFIDFNSLIKLFFGLGLVCLVYGNASVILILIFKSILVVLIPFVIFVMIEVLIDYDFISYVTIFFPTIKEGVSLLNVIHYLVLIILCNLISGLIYYCKDVS